MLQRDGRHAGRVAAWAAWILGASLLLTASVAAQSSDLRSAQRLLDQNQPERALGLLERHLAKNKKDASAWLLQSNAQFMLGDRAGGQSALDRALQLDPTLRQGWLNLGALLLSDGDHSGAIDAFQRAADLDPTSAENDLNLGTAHLLAGQAETAHGYFARYLHSTPTADANYLVATNFALADMDDFALEHLERAIALDQTTRMRIRSDPTFRVLAQDPRLAKALNTDTYVIPAGAAYVKQAFSVPYETSDGRVLRAVVDALTGLSIPFSPRIEVNETWTVLWIEREPQMRVKISARDARSSVLEVVGPGRDKTAFRAQIEPLLQRVGRLLLP